MIKIYSTPTCAYCIMAKDYFKKIGQEFQNFDVSVDQKAAEEMVQKTRQMGVPVIDINGTIIIGFNRAEIDKVLNRPFA